MNNCPQCDHENVPGTQFCEGCGEELAAANAAPSATVVCPACDNANPADNAACEVCGAQLSGGAAAAVPVAPPPVSVAAPVATPDPLPPVDAAHPVVGPPGADPIPVPPVAAAPVPPAPVAAAPADLPPGNLAPGLVKLVVEQGQTVGSQYVLGDAEMQVGREDTDDGIYPDIDLSDQDAGYVHRRHATLRFENGNLSVTHLGGENKTRINNKPIPDNQPMNLMLGDKVSFGKVVLRLLPV